MIELESIISTVFSLVPTAMVAALGVGALWFADRVLRRRSQKIPGEGSFRRELVMIGLSLVILIALVLVLPVSDGTRSSLVTLFSVGITAVIALSSTTLASNAMAGLMLRIVRNFKSGDYIRVGDFLGRVTERGLFHTEIQNERSDLVTLPNLYLASNAVTVIRPSGTFISATLSLGYDLQHDEIEKLLVEAAGSAGLLEAFVRIRSLGDFSVTYEVVGKLDDTKTFLGSKSALHRAVLDTLHRAGVEIVSPTFMNQRQIAAGRLFIPETESRAPVEPVVSAAPDSAVFDKADKVEKAEDLKGRLANLDAEIADLEVKLKEAKAASGEGTESLEKNLETRKAVRERLVQRISEMQKEIDD